MSPGENRESYRLQVIKALVQRYIDTARREFEESRRKDLGNRITELNKNVIRLQSEVKNLRRSVGDNSGSATNKSNENILSQYIMKVKGSFQNYDQESISSSKESPEVTVHQDSNQGPVPDDDCPPYPEEAFTNGVARNGEANHVDDNEAM
ncbi:hypothetical protein XENTR_v10007436 [Xenopus tropicalis]|nr:hypothetical protein XENTR_v10007436 [Xenopus tropicalis]